MGKFEITKRKNDDFQFNLKSGNGEIILTSQGYKTKASCLNGVESVRTNSKRDDSFDKKKSTNDKTYFNVIATNGQIIGTSQMYKSVSGRDNGIESVKKNAPDATLDDQTV